MFIQPVDYALAVWFMLAAASTLYVAFDQYRNNPEPVVMKWGFILVTLYLGPIGLLLYVLADKEPASGEHESFIAPLWKQGIGSTIHCVAGDATGIILAAAITAVLGLPMWLDLIVEYCAGFAVGLFVFQSLFMKSMMGGSYLDNVRKTFTPELISMNFVMAGMAPTMTLLMMGRDMRAMDPTELVFWGVMSFAVMVGFATAFPSNVWMVSAGIKHGLMTQRPKGSKFDIGSDAPSHDDGAKQNVDQGGKHGGGHRRSGADQRHGKAMSGGATLPQKLALSGVSFCALVLGVVAPGNSVNLSLSDRDVGGLVMPPGMSTGRDRSADAMRDMSFANPRFAKASYGAEAKGDQDLPFKLQGGVKVFDLTTSVVTWHILPDVAITAYAYNGQIPGPRIHVKEGDRVRINVHNGLPESTTVHWHGLIVPNQMDGPAEITQAPIAPGGSYAYAFTVNQHGTYFYHPHDKPDREQALGLYGAFIVDPADPTTEVKADHDYVIELQEWLHREGLTYPAMPMDGMQPNYFTINGKSYPSTETIHMRVGETLKVRFIGTNNGFIHPMHIHGGPFQVVARDGETIPESARYMADTVNVGPGQRYDVIWTARQAGKWLIHCHIPHHTANDNAEEKGGGGLMVVIDAK